ncbi:ribonuclease domain-containing protein [Variovorax dokdonensis]|uniref:ribonuclease domain-containing protein n=1 Tax=Variovorax dokdonensis TaxID=344883 RepID=UPI003626C46B
MVALVCLKSSVAKIAITGLAFATLVAGGSQALAREWSGSTGVQADRATTIALSELPPEGRRTYEAIFDGGPFRYDKDGSVFGNRERLLPREPRGHYREYTVDTPGSRDRGARRIVCGGKRKAPQACWYTADHYASFRRIVPHPEH